jgi:hypothetical protein
MTHYLSIKGTRWFGDFRLRHPKQMPTQLVVIQIDQ